MSAQRRTRTDLLDVWNDLVGLWSAEVPSGASEEGGRPARDSYTHARALLSASFDLHAADLIEFGSAEDEDGALLHLRPTLRPE